MAKVRVPKDVLDGLEAVRQSGMTNMLNRPVVVHLAQEMGYDETARWIEDHHKEFAQCIFHGVEALEDE